MPRAVALEIEFLRRRHGWSQCQLATMIGRSQGQIANGRGQRKKPRRTTGCRAGHNANSFRGGFQLWAKDSAVPPDLSPGGSRSNRRT
jgi:hypothetical protein